jgi:hypothetical protein
MDEASDACREDPDAEQQPEYEGCAITDQVGEYALAHESPVVSRTEQRGTYDEHGKSYKARARL